MRERWLVAIAAGAALAGVRAVPVPAAAPTDGLPALVVDAVEMANQRPAGAARLHARLVSVDRVKASGDRAGVWVTVESFRDGVPPEAPSRGTYMAAFVYRDGGWALTSLGGQVS